MSHGDASWALQSAIHAVLSADPVLLTILDGANLYDDVPRGTRPPYITVGRTRIVDWSTGTEKGAQHIISLNIWSKGPGRREALMIADAVSAALVSTPPAPDDHVLVSLEPLGLDAERTSDRGHVRVTLQYRALTERVD